jgi:hypothetical protein
MIDSCAVRNNETSETQMLGISYCLYLNRCLPVAPSSVTNSVTPYTLAANSWFRRGGSSALLGVLPNLLRTAYFFTQMSSETLNLNHTKLKAIYSISLNAICPIPLEMPSMLWIWITVSVDTDLSEVIMSYRWLLDYSSKDGQGPRGQTIPWPLVVMSVI